MDIQTATTEKKQNKDLCRKVAWQLFLLKWVNHCKALYGMCKTIYAMLPYSFNIFHVWYLDLVFSFIVYYAFVEHHYIMT